MANRLSATVMVAAVAGALAMLPAASFAAGTSNKTKMDHTHMIRTSKQVQDAQEALNKNGAQLKVDGKWGPKTRDAVKSFQQAHGLKATGRLDTETQKALQG